MVRTNYLIVLYRYSKLFVLARAIVIIVFKLTNSYQAQLKHFHRLVLVIYKCVNVINLFFIRNYKDALNIFSSTVTWKITKGEK